MTKSTVRTTTIRMNGKPVPKKTATKRKPTMSEKEKLKAAKAKAKAKLGEWFDNYNEKKIDKVI